VRGQVGYVGFRREGIAYKREKRIIGETHYNLLSAIRFGVAGILSSSTWPLRMLAYVGAALFALDLVVAPIFVLWTSLPLDAMVRWFAAGVAVHLGWLVLAAGTLGIYVARVYKDTIGLPLYVADPKHSTISTKRHHRE
jgi:dolichol-phosphate mannosyltransferase